MSERATKARTSPRQRGASWTESQARRMLAEWKKSGLSGVAFAESRGFSNKRLWGWQRRLRERSNSLSLVAVQLPVAQPAAVPIEIERHGVVVRVRDDVDGELLTRIVTALVDGTRKC